MNVRIALTVELTDDQRRALGFFSLSEGSRKDPTAAVAITNAMAKELFQKLANDAVSERIGSADTVFHRLMAAHYTQKAGGPETDSGAPSQPAKPPTRPPAGSSATTTGKG